MVLPLTQFNWVLLWQIRLKLELRPLVTVAALLLLFLCYLFWQVTGSSSGHPLRNCCFTEWIFCSDPEVIIRYMPLMLTTKLHWANNSLKQRLRTLNWLMKPKQSYCNVLWSTWCLASFADITLVYTYSERILGALLMVLWLITDEIRMTLFIFVPMLSLYVPSDDKEHIFKPNFTNYTLI